MTAQVLPIFEKAPVVILCHIIVPVSDLGFEELLASSNKVANSVGLFTDQGFSLPSKASSCKPEVGQIRINPRDLCLLMEPGTMNRFLQQDLLMGIISEVRHAKLQGRSILHKILLRG
eukprot:7885530-Ditylum_brightwellii.AAC.1